MLWIAVRAHRYALLGLGLAGVVLTYAQGSAYIAAAGTTAAARAAFGAQVTALGASSVYLVPLPIHPETFGGYALWKGYGAMSLIFGFWALMAATGAIRNEEERGRLELWLASGVGRLRYVIVRCVVFAVVAAIPVILTGLGTLLAGVAINETVSAAGLAQVCLALLGVTLACFSIGLLAAQLASSRRAAAALGGAVLLVLYLLDSLSRVDTSLAGLAVISPFKLYDRTTALAPGGTFDVPATIALFGIWVVIGALGVIAFWRRDLGAALLGRRPAPTRVVLTPSTNPLLRVSFLTSTWEQRLGLVGWLLGSILLAAYLISLTSAMKGLFDSAAFQGYFRAAGISDPKLVLIGTFWITMAAFLMAAYAITQVSRWASDDSEGRLEMTLAQPIARWRVVVDRVIGLALTSAVLSVAGAVVLAAMSPSQDLHLDGGNLAATSALLIVLALTFGGLGAAVTSWLPRLAVPVEAVVAVGGFFIQLLGPLFKWPDWALDLSIFRLVGTPLTTGVFWTGLYAMAAVIVIGFGFALLAMRTREVGA